MISICMALYSLYCAEVPLRNCSLTPHSMFGSRLGFSGSADRMAIFPYSRWRLTARNPCVSWAFLSFLPNRPSLTITPAVSHDASPYRRSAFTTKMTEGVDVSGPSSLAVDCDFVNEVVLKWKVALTESVKRSVKNKDGRLCMRI